MWGLKNKLVMMRVLAMNDVCKLSVFGKTMCYGKFYIKIRGKMNKLLYLCRPIGYIHLEAADKM